MEIQHFSHEHPLISFEAENNGGICKACWKDLTGPAYRCGQCRFFLHKSCTELPREIQCFFHPCILNLHIYLGSSINCDVCCRMEGGIYYRCHECQYNVCVKCAQLPTPTSDDDDQIRHFSHQHPLELVETKFEHPARCNACRDLCLSYTYQCKQCKFFLHKSCLENLPQKIEHFFHPCPRPLILLPSKWGFRCCACNEESSSLAFSCKNCKFQMDVQCALLPTRKPDNVKQIEYFSHGHALTLYDNENGSEVLLCRACARSCSGPIYACNRCNYYLHKSCIELPRLIQHPFHPWHPLNLQAVKQNYSVTSPAPSFTCDACEEICTGFIYHCSECYYSLHSNCASLTPSVKYGNHRHLLTLFEETSTKRFCEVCYRQCKGLHLRCVECKINLHVHCHPSVPQTIKHKCHIDPLSFTELPLPDDLDSDDEFYCDACETLRDPKDPVYYCAECDFAAHLTCVISEVLPKVTDQLGTEKEREDHIVAKLNKEISNLRGEVEELSEALELLGKIRQQEEEKKGDLEAGLEVLSKILDEAVEPLEANLTRKIQELEEERERFLRSRSSNTSNKYPGESSGTQESANETASGVSQFLEEQKVMYFRAVFNIANVNPSKK